MEIHFILQKTTQKVEWRPKRNSHEETGVSTLYAFLVGNLIRLDRAVSQVPGAFLYEYQNLQWLCDHVIELFNIIFMRITKKEQLNMIFNCFSFR